MAHTINLNGYVCTIPFLELEIHKNEYYFCCAAWLHKEALVKDYSVAEIWMSDFAKDIRETILDGSYKYCDKTQCPSLSSLINLGTVVTPGPILPASKFNTKNRDYPELINYNIDRTCNFKCPACRSKMIVANSTENAEIRKMLGEIDDAFAEHLKIMYISGAGDPFASPEYRNYLRNFDPKKFKQLQVIHIHSNASLWNKKMWDSMPNIHNYVKSCEISIDAATKDTYENHTRLNGNWETLLENLNFIKTLGNIRTKRFSFVVQKSNYKEMSLFVDLIRSIFGNKENIEIYFGKVNDWNSYTEEEYKAIKVWDKEHPEHQQFVEEFNKMWKKGNIHSNMCEFIIPEKNTRLI